MNTKKRIKTLFTLALLASVLFAVASANAAVIFTEGFENPDVTGYTNTQPTGWTGTGAINDNDSGGLTTPFGTQAAWTNSTNPLMTTTDILSDVLTENTIYTLSVNVGKRTNLGGGNYKISLYAGDTELDNVTGIPTTTDFSEVAQIVFQPDATHAALLGETLVIHLATNGGYQPHFDNVILETTAAEVDPQLPTVDPGSDWITWSGALVTLDDVSVIDNSDPAAGLTYDWSYEPVADVDVVFSATDVESPTITITKPAGDPVTLTFTLAANYVGSTSDPVIDIMTIDVYDNSCLAAQDTGSVVFDATDLNKDCITNLADFAKLAEDWLADYALTVPSVK
jgi:hypothetical protein